MAERAIRGRSSENNSLFVASPERADRLRFSGHQTFPFRYPWMPKAIQGLAEDPNLFFREDALFRLGVGKNMVASIRYWAEAMELAWFDSRTQTAGATELGAHLFGAEGWDPYLEYSGTAWLLHWMLVETPERASTWHYVFSRWQKDEFAKEEMTQWLADQAANSTSTRATLGSIARDVDTFVRSYLAPARAPRTLAEESFDSPLVELGLLRSLDGKHFMLNKGPKPTLPIEVFVFAMLRFWKAVAPNQLTLQFEQLLYGAGSPGRAFLLSENAFASMLERIPPWTGLRYDESSGLRRVTRQRVVTDGSLMTVLERYYRPPTRPLT
jgi:hypothetical protein